MLNKQLVAEVETLLRQARYDEANSKLAQIDPASLSRADYGHYCILLSEANLHSANPTWSAVDDAIDIYRHHSNSARFARAKFLKGWLLSSKGAFRDAREALLESYASYLRCGDSKGVCRALNRMSWVSFHLGEIDSSVNNLRKCADAYRHLSCPDNEALVRANLAFFLWVAGQLRESLEEYERVRPSVVARSDRDKAIHYAMSAVPLALRGDIQSARQVIAKAAPYIDEFPREKAICYENLGLIELLDGQHIAAESALKAGLEISLKIAPESSLVSQIKRLLGDVYVATGDIDQAEKVAEEALAVAEKVGERIEIAACWRIFAQVENRRGDAHKARAWFKQATALFNQLGTGYELAVTRYLAGTSGLYSNGEQKALLYLAREYFESEEVRPYVEKIDAALRTQPGPLPRARRPSQASEPVIVTRNAAMQKHLALARNIAQSDMTVLLTGETGSGKDLLARYIHYHSGRGGEFVSVNAAAIPGEMVESELFGFAEGAFTGASRDRAGLVEQAQRGTILLNEIADSSPQFQVKLLEALEGRCIRRLGENKLRRVDFRVVAATNQDLVQCVTDNRFRADLYHRLNEVHIHLPPLRQRADDIPRLVQYFLTMVGYDLSAGGSQEELQRLAGLLSRHSWPGNVRELQATVRRLWVTAEGDLGLMLTSSKQSHYADDAELLLAVLEETGWNRRETARRLGVTEGTIRHRIKKHNLCQSDFTK